MKNGHSPAHVVVVHAYGGSPRKFWYPSLKKHLSVTCLVTVPQLPGGSAPQVSTWLDSLRALLREDSGASVQQRSLFLVGHSLGCNAILRLLAGSETALLRGLRGVLFVAGWLWVDEPWEQIQPWCDPPPDLAAARQALVALGARATLLVSDNDRFTRDHERTRRMFQEGLGAHVVLCPGRAHFGGRKQDAVREELRRLMVDDNECRGGGGSPEQGSAAASAPLASGHGEGQAEGQRKQREAEGQAERQRVGVMEEQREGVMRLLDCAVDALNEVLDVLLTDFTAGCASLGRLACTCKHLRQLVRCAQPQIDARAAALGGAELSPLSLEQLAILESVASLCIYPSERCGSGVIATLYFTKGEARLRPGSTMDRLEEFAAMLRRHERASCHIDAHAMGARMQRREVSTARANAMVGALIDRGVAPGRIHAASWEEAVAGAAGWPPGGYEARRAEIYFTLDGVQLPQRPDYYANVGSEAETVWPRATWCE